MALSGSVLLLFLLAISTSCFSDTIPYGVEVSGEVGAACAGANESYEGGGVGLRMADGEQSTMHSCPDGRFGMASANSIGTTQGSLHAFAAASGNAGTNGEATFADASAYANFSNYLDFMPPADNPLSSGTIIFGMRVDGGLNGGNAGATACVDVIEFNIFECKSVSTISGDQGPTSFVVSAGITLTGPHSPILLTESLNVSASAGIGYPDSSADFGRTAEAFLELPPGWTFTSASGDFLSAAPVPEPGTFLPIGIIGLLACFRWRQPRGHYESR